MLPDEKLLSLGEPNEKLFSLGALWVKETERTRAGQTRDRKRIRAGSYMVQLSDGQILVHSRVPFTLPAIVDAQDSVRLVAYDENHDFHPSCDDVFPCSTPAERKADYHDGRPPVRLEIATEAASVALDLGLACSFGRLSETPSAALSVTMLLLPMAAAQNIPKMATPLFYAALKRNLVGLYFLWKEKCFTSEIKVSIRGTEYVLRVDSVVARQPLRAEPARHFLLLPSTRITILSQVSESKQSRSVNRDNVFTSPGAKLLIDTMDCMLRCPLISVPRAFLFTGQPGTGKTHSCRVAVQALGDACRLTSINGSDIMAAGQGPNAAQLLENIFLRAGETSKDESTTIALVFMDEFDALIESEPVMAMLALMLDRLSTDVKWNHLLVVAATNRLDSVPANFRRPGRFDKEVIFSPPLTEDRRVMLATMIRHGEAQYLPISDDELHELAETCVGFVPADLVALVRKAMLLRLQNTSALPFDLFKQAQTSIGASALRDAALSAPTTTTWSDIAGECGGAKLALQQAIEWPRSRRKAYQQLGLKTPRGCLLYGPPGTGKTLLARAAAGSSGVAFLSLSPADVYASSYVGDAEAVIRRAFALARAAAPCVLFFDEIDSIVGLEENVSEGMSRGHSAEARTLSTFLNEMDGVDGSMDDGVMVLGATNRLETIDRALLRPGRFDKVIHVPPPDHLGRLAILEMHFRAWETDTPLDYELLASEGITGGMTGAELVGVCREVGMKAFTESLVNGKRPVMRQSMLLEGLREACLRSNSRKGKHYINSYY